MLPQHKAPSSKRLDRRTQKEYWAYAPYNFVPLPDKLVTIYPPLAFDDFQGESGWIECNIETFSPTYTRGMLTRDQFEQFGSKKAEELTDDEKKQRAGFYSKNYANKIEGQSKPCLPGSALRGMIRTLVEIVSFGKMRWVDDSPRVSYRAVATGQTDPLSEPYKQLLKNVAAGYLKREDEEWFVLPAKKPKQHIGFAERNAYLKVKKTLPDLVTIPDFKDFNHPEYQPAYFEVKFNAEDRTDRRGNRYTAVTNIGDRDSAFLHKGVLVCSGNMVEIDSGVTESPRKNFALVLERDEAPPLKIPQNVLADYRETLTEFQQSPPFSRSNGCLIEGSPVFYVTDKSGNICAFGHTPNFRIPARRAGELLASTPKDFVPDHLLNDEPIDIADALFGWTPETKGTRKTSMAGRVFFEDAIYLNHTESLWYEPEPITPEILAAPKPTTFQHYLVQDPKNRHDPDQPQSLAHYATPKEETAIRGYKLYWHKNKKPSIKFTGSPAERYKRRTQLTRVCPINAGVSFRCKIRFENLRREELGALLWALSLPGESEKVYLHKFGMGKPLGMGAIQLTPKLFLTNREERYHNLFKNGYWHEGKKENSNKQHFITIFERFVLATIAPDKNKLSEVKRIEALLKMLEWPGPDPSFTRYLLIKHPTLENEYKLRPVLPGPLDGLEPPAVNRPAPANPPPVVTSATANISTSQQSIKPQISKPKPKQPKQSPPNPPAKEPSGFSGAKKEWVTIVKPMSGGKALVKTEQSGEFVCTSIDNLDPLQPGQQFRANVTYEKGKAVKAVFKGWK